MVTGPRTLTLRLGWPTCPSKGRHAPIDANLLAWPLVGFEALEAITIPQTRAHGYGRPRPLRAKTVATSSLAHADRLRLGVCNLPPAEGC